MKASNESSSVFQVATGGSYNISCFAADAEKEIGRLDAQVDLFWDQEIALYERLGLQDGMRLVDCGCGPGYWLKRLKKARPLMECTGIEMDPELVARAIRTTSGTAACSIVQGSITAMKFPDNSFDIAIARLVLEHLVDPMAALGEILRVLKPGGRAVILDNDFDFHERTWPDSPALDELYRGYCRARRSEGGNPCIGRQLPSLLERAGFACVDLHLIPAHNQIVGDGAFSRAEGSGIPAQLVRTGHLSPESLDPITSQWSGMLRTPGHAIFRMLFAATGNKPKLGGVTPRSNPQFRP